MRHAPQMFAVAALLALAECRAEPAATAPSSFVTDAQGRAIVLHGVNVSNAAKSATTRTAALTDADAERITGWGMNFVRLLLFWDGAEPTPGAYDDAYFARVRANLDVLAAHGIVALLDMHQDVYAQRFCCDGAPAWAIRDDGKSYTPQASWWQNYLEPAVTAAFDNFWSAAPPNDDLQAHYIALWGEVARRFHDHPAVVGYDVMNEPFPGSAFDIGTVLGKAEDETSASARFDRERLAPFYQRVIDRIRAEDDGAWIFVEPRYGAPGNGARSFLPRLEDRRHGPGGPRVVLAPHMYSFKVEARSSYDADDDSIAQWEARRKEDVALQEGPLVMGEFGLDASAVGADRFLRELLAAADRLRAGWAYWSYDPGAGGWSLWNDAPVAENANLGPLVRAYPQRIAGVPVEWGYDDHTRVFTVAFDDSPSASGPTEIYIPAKRAYPEGWKVEVADPPGSWSQSWDDAREVLAVSTAKAGRHVITVRPKGD